MMAPLGVSEPNAPIESEIVDPLDQPTSTKTSSFDRRVVQHAPETKVEELWIA